MARSSHDRPGAQEWVPRTADLRKLARAARDCHGCELYENATQTVFGEGPAEARVVLVGEQPGDQEDKQNHPFVGPAGKLLDRALADADIAREEVYVTNAVKHFRFRMVGGGKRRIHQKPDLAHLTACRPWLNAELAVIDPEVVVVLGASAASTLLGSSFRVTQHRGERVHAESDGDGGGWSGPVVPTVHPSSVLRSDDRHRAYDDLVGDLRTVAGILADGG